MVTQEKVDKVSIFIFYTLPRIFYNNKYVGYMDNSYARVYIGLSNSALERVREVVVKLGRDKNIILCDLIGNFKIDTEEIC